MCKICQMTMFQKQNLNEIECLFKIYRSKEVTAHFSGKKGTLWHTQIPNGWSSSTLLFKTINTYTWYVLFLVYSILL